MKAINVKYYTLPDKSSSYIKDKFYSVYLDSGQRFSFSDKKETQIFLISVGKTLTYFMHELTLISGELWSQVAETWILFDEIEADLFTSIFESIQLAQLLFRKKLTIETTANGANIALTNIRKMASRLLIVSDNIIMINKERNLTIAIKKAEFVKRRLEEIHEATFDMSKHVKK